MSGLLKRLVAALILPLYIGGAVASGTALALSLVALGGAL